jgi:hypothetical protein
MALVPQGTGGSSVSMAYPVLVTAKYTGWAIKVQVILDAQGLTLSRAVSTLPWRLAR